MRLSAILLAASALTLLANGSSLPVSAAASIYKRTTKVTADADMMLEGPSKGLRNCSLKRFLRTHDEERLAGAKMFNVEKLEKALDDNFYAGTLFQRWQSHGVDEAKVSQKLEGILSKKYAEDLLEKYRSYVIAHTKFGTLGSEALFQRKTMDKALGEVKSTNMLFNRWKSFGYDSDDVFKQFQSMGVQTDDDLYAIYLKYFNWLQIHHPLAKTKRTTPREFLFDATRIERAKSDPAFAENLYAKWHDDIIHEDIVYYKLQKMNLEKDNDIYKLYTNYVAWLDDNFPLPKKSIRT